jgi:hypothetical protein
MASETISINRAPVLTLWAAVVAERLGFKEDEALSLAKELVGMTAQAKGRRLGIIEPPKEKPKEMRDKKRGEQFFVELLGRAIPARNTEDGIRAVNGAKIIDPDSARRYLESKFGDDLAGARVAMERLAKSYPPKELAAKGFRLYERFRPSVPEGVKGWGAKGILDLGLIERLAKGEE